MVCNDYDPTDNPTDEFLVEQFSEAERCFLERELSKIVGGFESLPLPKWKIAKMINYAMFYTESRYIPLVPQSSCEQIELLIKYFPHRFSCGGKQPIKNFSPSQINHIFSNLILYAKKRLKINNYLYSFVLDK